MTPHRNSTQRVRRRAVLGAGAAAALLLGGVATVSANAGTSDGKAEEKAVGAVGTAEGFAEGTTGGGEAEPVTVGSLGEFEQAVEGDEPKVVQVDGVIEVEGQIDVGANTTLLGVGPDSGFTGGGLRLKEVENVIVQNLNISKPLAPADAISVQQSSKVWIDHNTLSADREHDKDHYDGLLDITHAGDDVTVSWNKFADHFKGSLVGHSDSNGEEDTGHLKVTYHHNHFSNVYSRLPSLRFGTGHVYNNLYDGADTGAHSRMGAQMLVEHNVFRDTKVAVTTSRSSDEDGYAIERDNDLGGAKVEISQEGSLTDPPYDYTPDATADVAGAVTAGAGAGKL